MRKTRLTLAALLATAMLAFPVTVARADTGYHPPVGPYNQTPYAGADVGIPTGTTLGSSATVTGSLVQSRGIRNLSVSVTASHAYSSTLTTYLDTAGTIAQESVTATGTSNQVQLLRTTANYPFAAFKVTITDTSSSTGTCGVRYALGQN